MHDYYRVLRESASKLGVEVVIWPPDGNKTLCNDCNALKTKLQSAAAFQGVLINPGGYCKTVEGDEIADALRALKIPSICTHYTNGEVPRSCKVAAGCTGTLLGVKEHGLDLGLHALNELG